RWNVLLANRFCRYLSFADTKTDQGTSDIGVIVGGVNRKQRL
ncbi:unnamed protein product, partial [marine sediment metagenome]